MLAGPKQPFAAPMSRPPKNRAIADNWRGLYGRGPISSTLPDVPVSVLRNGAISVNIIDSAVFYRAGNGEPPSPALDQESAH